MINTFSLKPYIFAVLGILFLSGQVFCFDGDKLHLSGSVKSIKIKSLDKSSSLLRVKLNLIFVNEGDKPAILYNASPLYHGAGLVARIEDFETGKWLGNTYGGRSCEYDSNWELIRKKLDQSIPPSDLVRFIKPQERWETVTEVRFVLPKNSTSRFTSTEKAENLENLRKLSPFWLKVEYESYPKGGLESDCFANAPFGRSLQEKWKNYGDFFVENIISDPIKISIKSK